MSKGHGHIIVSRIVNEKPKPYEPELQPVMFTPCCAACRRGVKGFGQLPCGVPGRKCKCHRSEWAK